MSIFSDIFGSRDVENAVLGFPATFEKARADWAKFKVGYQNKLFTPSQIKTVIDWYREFPKLWETIRPSFEDVMAEKTGSYNVNFVPTVDAWVESLQGDQVYRTGLGVLPVLVGAVLIVGGIAAGLWAVGYIKKQSNISSMIDGVTAGKIPASVLQDAIDKEAKTDLWANISDIVTWVAVGAAVILLGPPLIKMFTERKSA